MRRISLVLSLFAIALLITACIEQDLRFQIRFRHVEGLQVGDQVLLAGRHVGEVEDIDQVEDGTFWVAVRIGKQYRSQVTDQCEFTLRPDPKNPSKRVVWIEPGNGGKPIEDGTLVEGSEPISLFGPLFKGFGEGLELLERQLKGLTGELEKLPESPQFKQFQQQLEELARQLQEAEEKMQKDVIPKLQQEMERLQKELKKSLPKQEPKAPSKKAIDL